MADTEKTSSATAPAKDGKKAARVKPKQGRPRNYKLPTGVYRFSRSRMIKKRALYRYMGKERKVTEPVKKKKKPKPLRYKKKPIGGEKNGQFRLIRIKKLVSVISYLLLHCHCNDYQTRVYVYLSPSLPPFFVL